MKTVKAKSSKIINDHASQRSFFEWQEWVRSFSYSQSQFDNSITYKNLNSRRSTTRGNFSKGRSYLELLNIFKLRYYDESTFFQELI